MKKSRSSTRNGRNWHFWLCSNVWSSTMGIAAVCTETLGNFSRILGRNFEKKNSGFRLRVVIGTQWSLSEFKICYSPFFWTTLLCTWLRPTEPNRPNYHRPRSESETWWFCTRCVQTARSSSEIRGHSWACKADKRPSRRLPSAWQTQRWSSNSRPTWTFDI